MSRKPLAVTLGDPAGVGPEILVKAFARGALTEPFIVIGDICALEAGMRAAETPVDIHTLGSADDYEPGMLNLLAIGALRAGDWQPGQISARCGDAAFRYIEVATHLALEGAVSGIVTLPVNKEAVQLSHPGFTGHTEMIAALCDEPEVVMMLSSERLTVTHATTHVSMREAIDLITQERVLGVIRLTREALLGEAEPHIAVAGLNAHAGENGMFGREEIEHIAPAIERARAEGIDVSGPYPPDTVFLRAAHGEFDAVVCMYHDQGHVPLKLLDFTGGVNVTLGLPILRTSVDHGTAFDIVMQNKADDRSFVEAFDLAARMARDNEEW